MTYTEEHLKTVHFISQNGVGAFEGSYPFINSTIEECKEWCLTQDVLGVDTETEGLNFLKKKIVMFQIGNNERQYVIDTRTVSIEPLREVLESKKILKVFHYYSFDGKFIQRWFNIRCKNVWDTFITEKILYCGYEDFGYSLGSLCARYLGVSLDKSVRNQFINLRGAPFTVAQIRYGADDTRYLPSIVDKQRVRIASEELSEVSSLENEVVRAFTTMEYNGMIVDTEEWSKVAKSSKNELVEASKKLDAIVLKDPSLSKFVSKYIQGDLFTDTEDLRKVNLNWSSPTQVVKVLNTVNSNIISCAATELIKYKYSHNIVREFGEYQKVSKKVSSYGYKFLDLIWSDGKVHTSFNQVLTTGRVSSSEPNMQQLPANNIYRNCFIPPKGYKYVSADYSSQELCIIAEFSKDPVWISALERGEDLHSICAHLVYKDGWESAGIEGCLYKSNKQKCECPKHKTLRDSIKSINFGLAYGMSEFKLSDQMGVSVKIAKDLITSYFRTFPEIGKLLNFLGRFGVKNAYIKTFPPYNRKRYFGDLTNADELTLGSVERKSKNTPIQGTAADMTKLALINVCDELEKDEWDGELVMTVHDQIDTIIRENQAEAWAERFKIIMEEAAKVSLPSGRLKAEVTISNKWQK